MVADSAPRSPTATSRSARPRRRISTGSTRPARTPRSSAGRVCPRPITASTRSSTCEKCEQERAAGKTFNFLAVDDEDRILGSFGLMELDKAPRYGEIGYWVAKDARGKGVATRAVTLLRDWAAQRAGLRAGRARDPRGQRALGAGRRAHRLPRHRRAADRAAPGGRHGAGPRGLRLERPRRPRACGGRSRPSRTPAAATAAIRSSRAGSLSSAVSACASASGSPGATSSAPVDLREAADARQQQRLPERHRGEQHAGLVDLAVRAGRPGRPRGRRRRARRWRRSAAPCGRSGRG